MKTKLMLILILSGTGCVVDNLHHPNGLDFTTKRFFWPGKIGFVAMTTNGFEMRGYTSQSNPNELAGAIAEGVVRGMKK